MTFFSRQPSDKNLFLEQVEQYRLGRDYSKVATLYEQAIEAEPEVKSHYWHLGLMLLLQRKEEEATSTWLLGMLDGEAEQVDSWTAELLDILEQEAQYQETRAEPLQAWLIRGHIREINPEDLNNLLSLIHLGISLDYFGGEELIDWGVSDLLQQPEEGQLDQDKLLQVFREILSHHPIQPSSLEFIEAALPHLQEHHDVIGILLPASLEIGYSLRKIRIAISILEMALQIDEQNLEVLRHLAAFYQYGIDYSKGIELAMKCYSLVETLPEKIFANHLLMRGLMSAGGHWETVCSTIEEQERLLASLIAQEPTPLPQATVARLLTSGYFFPYFRDQLRENRQIMNQLLERCQWHFQFSNHQFEQVRPYYQSSNGHRTSKSNALKKRLNIGYISHCLKVHSVGWLVRWLIQHHNREQFKIHGYLVTNPEVGDPLNEWYLNEIECPRKLGGNNWEIAEQIYQDDIDILIDLDSITMDVTCEVMALKPAPIQVTWLGWDASGIPMIDYFIADPYVLPESAQEYYREKIWRLPETYIAVDGFEVGVPTLRRDELNIPSDAIVYFSGQKGYKRHPDTARLQMQIIKQVPNSYFLIKGFGDNQSIQSFFIKLAEEEGVECDRLRFLPPTPSEAIHRANLGIADVVLDTYPYNGATTTLETLWMGIPLVTRVGEQFAARNSYTMMMNVGITEGIAWTDEEYVEWGVRLGKDAALRQDISWRLRRSRQTAPLWNAQKFTREMENAYTQMWETYVLGLS
ncbi:O-linked N-acetylglucosamine transferase, SPINDLY family protein [Laspinema sp. D1]|uniref:O-linked N-acetylglucosamine transferase, SPINDLY family protein n=1 Tax=Laspinema palackyanum TaxID=3231601 RepID=UPI003487ED2F|nr:O-linked N-acetylglucosamine transferase, SPINDLY family protein [Laspinema sp. D2b]